MSVTSTAATIVGIKIKENTLPLKTIRIIKALRETFSQLSQKEQNFAILQTEEEPWEIQSCTLYAENGLVILFQPIGPDVYYIGKFVEENLAKPMRPEDFTYMKFAQWELDYGYQQKMMRANAALEDHRNTVAEWITETLKYPVNSSDISIVTDKFES